MSNHYLGDVWYDSPTGQSHRYYPATRTVYLSISDETLDIPEDYSDREGVIGSLSESKILSWLVEHEYSHSHCHWTSAMQMIFILNGLIAEYIRDTAIEYSSNEGELPKRILHSDLPFMLDLDERVKRFARNSALSMEVFALLSNDLPSRSVLPSHIRKDFEHIESRIGTEHAMDLLASLARDALNPIFAESGLDTGEIHSLKEMLSSEEVIPDERLIESLDYVRMVDDLPSLSSKNVFEDIRLPVHDPERIFTKNYIQNNIIGQQSNSNPEEFLDGIIDTDGTDGGFCQSCDAKGIDDQIRDKVNISQLSSILRLGPRTKGPLHICIQKPNNQILFMLNPEISFMDFHSPVIAKFLASNRVKEYLKNIILSGNIDSDLKLSDNVEYIPKHFEQIFIKQHLPSNDSLFLP